MTAPICELTKCGSDCANTMPSPAPRYNVAPTDKVPIIRIDPRDGVRELVMARWGLVPFWSMEIPKIPHINARGRRCIRCGCSGRHLQKRRALIPATGFFEWQKRADGKQPYRFQQKDLEPFAFVLRNRATLGAAKN